MQFHNLIGFLFVSSAGVYVPGSLGYGRKIGRTEASRPLMPFHLNIFPFLPPPISYSLPYRLSLILFTLSDKALEAWR